MAMNGSAITRGSFISLGLVIGLIIATYWATTKWSNLETALQLRDQNLETRFDSLHRDLQDLRNLLIQNNQDRWTGTDMRFWTSELRRMNPDFMIPNVERITTVGFPLGRED